MCANGANGQAYGFGVLAAEIVRDDGAVRSRCRGLGIEVAMKISRSGS
jgi:hypothetical protein